MDGKMTFVVGGIATIMREGDQESETCGGFLIPQLLHWYFHAGV